MGDLNMPGPCQQRSAWWPQGGTGRAEAVQLVCGHADLLQRFFESVLLVAIGAQDGFDDALQKAPPCAVCV